jgi:hypothetical protein
MLKTKTKKNYSCLIHKFQLKLISLNVVVLPVLVGMRVDTHLVVVVVMVVDMDILLVVVVDVVVVVLVDCQGKKNTDNKH